MTEPVAMVRHVTDGDLRYDALMFCCPGCKGDNGGTGLHLLPISDTQGRRPRWTWNGNLEAPTLDPSIMTKFGKDGQFVCHSYLRDGVFQFLDDCTHKYKGQHVPLEPLPLWVVTQNNDD